MNKNRILINKIIIISILSAISLVLYIVGPKFPLPIFPSFLEINFSMLPILFGLLLLSYKEALIILCIRLIIKLPFSSTFFVGEIADFILGFTIISITGIFAKMFKKHLLKLAVITLLAWILGAIISNCFSLPLYMRIFGGKEVIINLMSMIPNVNADNYFIKYIIYCCIPFNLIIGIIVVLISYLINKRLSIYLDNHDFGQKE